MLAESCGELGGGSAVSLELHPAAGIRSATAMAPALCWDSMLLLSWIEGLVFSCGLSALPRYAEGMSVDPPDDL